MRGTAKTTLPEIAKRAIQKSKSVSDFKNVNENYIDRGYESEPEMEENLNVPIITTDLASIKSMILGRVSGNTFQAISFMPWFTGQSGHIRVQNYLPDYDFGSCIRYCFLITKAILL